MADKDFMEEEVQGETLDNQRRKLLITAGKAVAIAPAVSLILASGSKPAAAGDMYGGDNGGGGPGCGCS